MDAAALLAAMDSSVAPKVAMFIARFATDVTWLKIMAAHLAEDGEAPIPQPTHPDGVLDQQTGPRP